MEPKKRKTDSGSLGSSPGKPFDDHRGCKSMGGWWIDLEKATTNGMGEEWWKQVEQPNSQPVKISCQKGGGKDNTKPVWMYENGTMYVGEWIQFQNGKGQQIVWTEHGTGVICRSNGSCYVGQFQNGLYHGWGRSFWLKDSLVWKKNENKDEKHIRQTQMLDDQRETSIGLPYEYHGKFFRNEKQFRFGTVTLKDGTKKVGPWSSNIPVKPSAFLCSSSDNSTEKHKADWWLDHSDVENHPEVVILDSPAARRNKNKRNRDSQQMVSSSESSIVPAESSRKDRKVRITNLARHRMHLPVHYSTPTTHHRGRIDPNNDGTNDHDPASDESMEGKDPTKHKKARSADISNSKEAPLNHSCINDPYQMSADVYFSESEERDLPLHAAIKFGSQEFFDEALENLHSPFEDGEGINARDSKGRTPLDLAALTGQLDFVEQLRSIKGAQFAFKSGPRMMILAQKRSKHVGAYLEHVMQEVE